jgi:hypothetical protein
VIYKTEAGDYVISSRGMWLPGTYDSERTARFAFRFSDETLARIRDEVSVKQGRPITADDLRAARTSS